MIRSLPMSRWVPARSQPLREKDHHLRRFPRGWSLAQRIRASMEKYPWPGAVDPISVRDLGTLLRLTRERGARVVMVATPMHAAARAIWRRDGYGDDEQRALDLLARLARQTGARFVDFSSAGGFGADPDGFFDGFHPTLATTRRMTGALFPGTGRRGTWSD